MFVWCGWFHFITGKVLAASRAVLASELGKLAAEAKTLAAEKLEEKIQLAAIGTKLEKKQLDSAVREAWSMFNGATQAPLFFPQVLEHAEVSAADALWAAQTVLSESAAINERVKKSSASALMQLRLQSSRASGFGRLFSCHNKQVHILLTTKAAGPTQHFVVLFCARTGQWQAATSKIAAEAPMFMAELVIFQRTGSFSSSCSKLRVSGAGIHHRIIIIMAPSMSSK